MFVCRAVGVYCISCQYGINLLTYSMAGTIKIISLNCRGLRDSYKRKDMFDYLHSKNYNIYCLQDTHFTEEDENIIRSQWGYDCYISPGRSNARGVAVLFNNNFEHKVLKKSKMQKEIISC